MNVRDYAFAGTVRRYGGRLVSRDGGLESVTDVEVMAYWARNGAGSSLRVVLWWTGVDSPTGFSDGRRAEIETVGTAT